MATHTLLESAPVDGYRRRLWYVDGQRVPFFTFWKLEQRARRADSFSTTRAGDRWQHRKVITL